MNPNTYDALPPDVRADLPVAQVTLDGSIPDGHVDIYGQGRWTRMPVNAFVRARRKARKADRRNRKAGH